MIAIVVMAYLFFFLTPGITRVHAYLDPGNGSYMIQLLFGGILGLVVSIKVFWKSIYDFFHKLFYRKTVSKKEE